MFKQNVRSQQFDRYNNKTLSSNFQRRFYFVNQSYKSNVYQNNQYIDYFRNYDFQKYDYQNQNYQNNQNNQKYRLNQNQNQQRFFQFKFNQFYKSNENRYNKTQRMYQINVKNEMSNISSKQTDEQNIDKNENQNTYHDQHEKNNN